MATITDIKKKIFDSGLSFQEKEDLAWLFDGANNEEIEAADELFTENPVWIKRLSDNYKKKRLAFLSNDVELWKQILEEEKSFAAA